MKTGVRDQGSGVRGQGGRPLGGVSTATYMRRGKMHCAESVTIPAGFFKTLDALADDMRLAIECISIFGGVPVPLAKAILRNIDPAIAAINMALKSRDQGSRRAPSGRGQRKAASA